MRKNYIKPINKTGLLIFCAVADSRNSPKNAKYREIDRFFCKFAPENPAKCSRNIRSPDKMNLGAGALRVEGRIVQKRGIALEVTMATK